MLTALHAASLAFPSPSHSSRPHRFPFHVGGKLSTCLQEQLGLVCSAVTLWPRQSRLCPECPEADGSALAGVQELQGVVGFEAWACKMPILQGFWVSLTVYQRVSECRLSVSESRVPGLSFFSLVSRL